MQGIRPSVGNGVPLGCESGGSGTGVGATADRDCGNSLEIGPSRGFTSSNGGRPPGNSNGREAVLEKLLTADFDTFPELPNDAQAVYTGLATLRWARDQLGIDGLSISEIHKFLSEKLRYSQTAQAYRYAFNQLPRATNATGDPKVYRLMRAGDQALDAYFETIAAGGSQKEAEAAGADAEGHA